MNAKIHRLLRSAARLWLASLGVALFYPGCSSGEHSEEGCTENAQCAADERCTDGRCETVPNGCSGGCEDGERCVNATCLASCATESDCASGQVCAVWTLDDGSEDTLCAVLEGRYTSCTDDTSCDTEHGFGCVDGTCSIPCRSHSDCSSVGHCAPLAGATYCVPGTPAEKGGYYTRCPNGGADCSKEGFVCQGAGVGDIDSYCTTDCDSDADCPLGYGCSAVRVPPCAAACDVSGSPDRADCAPTREIGPGRTYRCGVLTALRNLCVRRSFCSECASDEDCLGVPGQICAEDGSGAKICTEACDLHFDSCPWGNAAECSNFDPSRGFPTCAHRFGSCKGSGKSCEPCLEDSDCGTRGVCSTYNFSHERFCIDLTHECVCGEDADANGICKGHGCPESPGGLELSCLAPRAQGDPLGNRCYGATYSNPLSGTDQATCWRR